MNTNKEWDKNKKYPQYNKIHDKNEKNDKKKKLMDIFITKTTGVIENNDCCNLVDMNMKSMNKISDVNNSDSKYDIDKTKEIKELEKSLNFFKDQCKHFNDDNLKLRVELKNIKRINYKLKEANKVTLDNCDKEIKELQNKIFMHKFNHRKLNKTISYLENENAQINEFKGEIKKANNTIKQLRESNKRIITKIKELQSNDFCSFYSYILIENKKLNNTVKSLLGELKLYKDRVEELKNYRENKKCERGV